MVGGTRTSYEEFSGYKSRAGLHAMETVEPCSARRFENISAALRCRGLVFRPRRCSASALIVGEVGVLSLQGCQLGPPVPAVV